jgi:hypothetical protein
MTQVSMPPHPSSPWPDALRRGATLGVVAACHLALLLLMVRPAAHRESRPRGARSADHALRLVFLPSSTPTPVAKARPPRLSLPPPRRSRPKQDATPQLASPTMVVGPRPRPSADHDVPGYHEGDFRRRLQNAQRVRAVPLPGSAAPRVGGLRVRVRPSARDLVRQLTVATRCTAEGFKMRDSKTQFITAQLMDRALEADGCGPHTGRDPASDVVDAVTRQLMDER